MSLAIKILDRGVATPTDTKNTIYLTIDNWDDFSYKTQFYVEVIDGNCELHSIGSVKIGYENQSHGYTVDSWLPKSTKLDERYFSLGQDVSYYKKISELPSDLMNNFCLAMRDVVYKPEMLERAMQHSVFKTSLLREVSYASITGQFFRVLNGGALLTSYDFSYKKPAGEKNAPVELSFRVIPDSKPQTNIHILIGRNGVGKTQILNDMVCAIFESKDNAQYGSFYEWTPFSEDEIDFATGYFSSVVSVAFSAFDPFLPLRQRTAESDLIKYYYVGLKKDGGEQVDDDYGLKGKSELKLDFAKSLSFCLNEKSKKSRWVKAISMLEFDSNFKEMRLSELAEIRDSKERDRLVKQLFLKMSSGHAIVLLSITRLVERLEEKTLVLIDEPESHLHPPLLSAFVRALADLLVNRNAVAIIATHSPVILQEVPKSCVWKLWRDRLNATAYRPENETFGENVGTLTRDVFGLDVEDSGFIRLLKQAVALPNSTYKSILEDFNYELGFEGRSILRALIADREDKEQLQ